VTAEDAVWFVTYCGKCGKATRFEVPSAPQTAAELEDVRARVAAACPEHGEIAMDELRKMVERGKVHIAPPVLDELRTVFGVEAGGRVS
jgi:hypothetical protein